ncbi:PQQ-binding-like beta-propeller repeat protein, partial [Gemmatimonadota bacterium]
MSRIVSPALLLVGCTTDPDHGGPGTVRWYFETGGSIDCAPAISDEGVIHITAQDGLIRAIDPRGNLIWTYPFIRNFYSSPVLAANGDLYTGTNDHLLLSVTGAGAANFIWESEGEFSSAPALDADGTIYYGHGEYPVTGKVGIFWSLDPALSPNWTTLIPDYLPWFTAVIGPEGNYHVFSTDSLYTVHPDDGDLLWSLRIPGQITSRSPAVDRQGIIYLGTDEGVVAVSASGTILWHYQLDALEIFSPVIGSDGTIYAGSRNG